MFRNIIRSLFTKGGVAIINFMLLIVSARYLGVSSRGEISIFILNLTLIQIVNEIYTGYTLVHFIPRYHLLKLFSTGVVYTFIFCSLSNLLIVFIHRQVNGFEWLAYIISLLVLLNTFNCVFLLGRELVGLYNFLSLLQPLILLAGIAVFVFIVKDFTFRAYVYPLLISFIIALVISTTLVVGFVFKHNSGKEFQLRPILTNGFLSQAGILLYVFCNRYGYYLLPERAEVGLYSSACSLTESVLIIMNGIAPVLLARVANLGSSSASAELTLSLSKLSLLLSGLALLILLLLPESLFIFLMGKGFTGIRHLMLLYAPGVLLVSASGILSAYFSAMGKPGLLVLCNCTGCAFSIALAPVLVHHFQMAGAACAADIAYTAIALTAAYCFFKTSKLPLRRLFSLQEDYTNLKQLFLRNLNNPKYPE